MTVGDITGSDPVTTKSTAELQSNFIPFSSMWNYLRNNDSSFSPLEGKRRFVAPDFKKAISWKEGDQAVALLDENGQVIKNVIETRPHDYIDGVWTSDSEWFVFIHERNNKAENYQQALMVHGDGSKVVQLTPKVTGSIWGGPEMSPDNQKMAFNYLFVEGTNKYQIGIIWLDDKDPKFQTISLQEGINLESSLSSKLLYWSPDSNWVAFFNGWVEKDYGGMDIHAMDINSGDVYCVTHDITGKTLMDWK